MFWGIKSCPRNYVELQIHYSRNFILSLAITEIEPYKLEIIMSAWTINRSVSSFSYMSVRGINHASGVAGGPWMSVGDPAVIHGPGIHHVDRYTAVEAFPSVESAYEGMREDMGSGLFRAFTPGVVRWANASREHLDILHQWISAEDDNAYTALRYIADLAGSNNDVQKDAFAILDALVARGDELAKMEMMSVLVARKHGIDTARRGWRRLAGAHFDDMHSIVQVEGADGFGVSKLREEMATMRAETRRKMDERSARYQQRIMALKQMNFDPVAEVELMAKDPGEWVRGILRLARTRHFPVSLVEIIKELANPFMAKEGYRAKFTWGLRSLSKEAKKSPDAFRLLLRFALDFDESAVHMLSKLGRDDFVVLANADKNRIPDIALISLVFQTMAVEMEEAADQALEDLGLDNDEIHSMMESRAREAVAEGYEMVETFVALYFSGEERSTDQGFDAEVISLFGEKPAK